ncbi:MAG: hypothetical protein MH204_06465, partial [Fimbriimonadaceae bacterium]|nr:hypothetical protein [Fimbriimonadaceae bacterium]
MSKPPYAVLVSRRSRLGSSILGRLESDHRGRAAFVLPVQTEGQMKAGIEWARQEGVESVWVAGGDGTIRRAAGLLAGGPMTLAVLPIGTGNALARDLNLPLNPFAAAEFHLRNRHREQIDLGFCNGMPFVNSVTAGLTTSIVRPLDRE